MKKSELELEREGGNDVSRAFYSMDFDETVLSLCGLQLYESNNTLINSYIPIKRKWGKILKLEIESRTFLGQCKKKSVEFE